MQISDIASELEGLVCSTNPFLELQVTLHPWVRNMIRDKCGVAARLKTADCPDGGAMEDNKVNHLGGKASA